MAAIAQVRSRTAAVGKRGLVSRGGQRAAQRVIPSRVALHSMKNDHPPLDSVQRRARAPHARGSRRRPRDGGDSSPGSVIVESRFVAWPCSREPGDRPRFPVPAPRSRRGPAAVAEGDVFARDIASGCAGRTNPRPSSARQPRPATCRPAARQDGRLSRMTAKLQPQSRPTGPGR